MTVASKKTKKSKKGVGAQSFSAQELGVVKRITPIEDIIHLAGICNPHSALQSVAYKTTGFISDTSK